MPKLISAFKPVKFILCHVFFKVWNNDSIVLLKNAYFEYFFRNVHEVFPDAQCTPTSLIQFLITLGLTSPAHSQLLRDFLQLEICPVHLFIKIITHSPHDESGNRQRV